MRALNAITLLLVIIGGTNWGLVGLFDVDQGVYSSVDAPRDASGF